MTIHIECTAWPVGEGAIVGPFDTPEDAEYALSLASWSGKVVQTYPPSAYGLPEKKPLPLPDALWNVAYTGRKSSIVGTCTVQARTPEAAKLIVKDWLGVNVTGVSRNDPHVLTTADKPPF